MDSIVIMCRLSCSTACGILDPGPGIEPASTVLQGRFLTTRPPEKSHLCIVFVANQSILKEISPECSLEGLVLKLKLQYFGHLLGRADSFEKVLMLGKIGETGMAEDEMVGWHH